MLLLYRVSNWEQAAALHNQCLFRLATSLFAHPDSPLIPEMRDRLRTGSINVNRGTIGASLRLPSLGLGRASNGIPGGLELLYSLTHPRSQLVETRPFVGMPVLPGTHWNDATPVEAEEEPEDTEEEDLSEALELTAE
jgi:acyl-CoA reductase-like NAD-dependent aldehyde dehydrogenase